MVIEDHTISGKYGIEFQRLVTFLIEQHASGISTGDVDFIVKLERDNVHLADVIVYLKYSRIGIKQLLCENLCEISLEIICCSRVNYSYISS